MEYKELEQQDTINLNLRDITGKEMGIIRWEDDAVGVYLWRCNNGLPRIFMFAIIYLGTDEIPEDEIPEGIEVDDIREYLPGSYFVNRDNQLETDIRDIVCDRFYDIPKLFGFEYAGDNEDKIPIFHQVEPEDVSGIIYEIKKYNVTIICPNMWD